MRDNLNNNVMYTNKHFTEEQYNLINNSGTITKEMALKVGFRTAKEAKEARTNMNNLREERKSRQSINNFPYSKAYNKYLRLRGRQIFNIINCPTHYEVHYNFGDDFRFDEYTRPDWKIYSKSYKYPAQVHSYEITIPRYGMMIQEFDGITTTYIHSRTIGDVTLLSGGYILSLRRGCMDLNVIPTCVALSHATYDEKNKEWHYSYAAHATDGNRALIELRKKIKKGEAEKNFKLTPDTKITASQYQKLTGACTEGTNAWLQAHGYDRRKIMTVRELLTILEPTDYGYKTLIKLLANS